MKPILIATAIAAVAAIGIARHSKLSELNAETARLMAEQPAPTAKRSDRAAANEIKPNATAEQFELVRDEIIKEFAASRNHQTRADPERMKQLILAASAFSADDISRFFDLLRSDPRSAGMEQNSLADACREIFSRTAPLAWRDYLEAHRDLPDWQGLFDDAFRNCLLEDSKHTLQQFDEESSRGNPDLATTGIRTSVLLELATSDPDKMLAHAVSPEFTADPDALAHLGGFVGSRLKQPADHQRFLAALRRAQEKNPSPVLAKIREDYTREIAGHFYKWPADQAIALIDSEFTPAERFHVAEQSASRGDLADPEKWVDWFLKIDPAEWAAWTAQQGNAVSHPLVRQIASRSIEDADLPAKWLEKIPPGELRDKATQEYAWMIADRDPDRAAGYLDQLPANKGKQNLVKKIDEARQGSKSPAR